MRKFYIYRVAQQSSNLLSPTRNTPGIVFQSGIFFSTSKKQVLGYKNSKGSYFLKVDGLDFWSSIRNQNLKVILLTPYDCVYHDHICYNCDYQNPEYVSFMKMRTFEASQVSLRMLSNSLEVIVLRGADSRFALKGYKISKLNRVLSTSKSSNFYNGIRKSQISNSKNINYTHFETEETDIVRRLKPSRFAVPADMTFNQMLEFGPFWDNTEHHNNYFNEGQLLLQNS